MAEVQELRQQSVRPVPAPVQGRAGAAPAYLLASAVAAGACAWFIAADGWVEPSPGRTTALLSFIVLCLVRRPWVRSRCPMRERIILRMVDVHVAVVLVTLMVASSLGWGEMAPVLAAVLAVAPPLLGLGGLWALSSRELAEG